MSGESDVVLQRWAVHEEPWDGYTAPELRERYLSGFALNHPRFTTPGLVHTTPIRKIAGRRITTASGTVYRLEGDPADKYLEWMRTNGYRYDPENPIGVGPDSRKIASEQPPAGPLIPPSDLP